jgi:hypothetical protein
MLNNISGQSTATGYWAMSSLQSHSQADVDFKSARKADAALCLLVGACLLKISSTPSKQKQFLDIDRDGILECD